MTKVFKAGDKVVAKVDNVNSELGKDYVIDYIYSRDSVMVKGINIAFPANCFGLFVEKPTFKAMKFRISSPEQSKEVQEALFSLGYGWEAYGQQLKFLDSGWTPWLNTNEDGIIYRCGENIDEFHPELAGCEYTIKATKSYEFIPVEISKPQQTIVSGDTIELNGEMYTQEEVASAVQFLKSVRKNLEYDFLGK